MYGLDPSTAFTDLGNGNLTKMLSYVEDQAQAEFGESPYFVLDPSWFSADPGVEDVASAEYNWFSPPGSSTLTSFNGIKMGIATPSYYYSSTDPKVIDPNHGQTLQDGLKATVGAGANVTLVEGFTDFGENNSLWRAADGTYAARQYDYPNQRLDILRSFSHDPFPTPLTVQAESADYYYDTTPGNRWGLYRAGDLDIEQTTDTGGGWDVGNTAPGEWLQWESVPLQGTTTIKVRVATPNSGETLHVTIDGEEGPSITIPDTGGWQQWETVNAGTWTFPAGTSHVVRIAMETGGINVNYWTN